MLRMLFSLVGWIVLGLAGRRAARWHGQRYPRGPFGGLFGMGGRGYGGPMGGYGPPMGGYRPGGGGFMSGLLGGLGGAFLGNELFGGRRDEAPLGGDVPGGDWGGDSGGGWGGGDSAGWGGGDSGGGSW